MKTKNRTKPLLTVMLLALAAMTLCLAGCGSPSESDSAAGAPGDNTASDIPASAVGLWQCEATASDNETDTSFYELQIGENGEFSLYDYAAGNPGISGTIGSVSDTTMDVQFNTDDFDPPFCWDLDEDGDTLAYESDGTTLRLGHNDVWLTFHPAE